MLTVYFVIIFGVAVWDGYKLVREKKWKEVMAYGAIITLAAALILLEKYTQFNLNIIFFKVYKPMGEAVVNFLQQY